MVAVSSYKARRQAGKWPVSMEFSASEKRRLQAWAVKEQRSMAAICRIAVAQYLDRAGAPKARGR